MAGAGIQTTDPFICNLTAPLRRVCLYFLYGLSPAEQPALKLLLIKIKEGLKGISTKALLVHHGTVWLTALCAPEYYHMLSFVSFVLTQQDTEPTVARNTGEVVQC